ncbi:MAG: hypothetical protein V4662_20005 [Verrucomicrobiota bacterium]
MLITKVLRPAFFSLGALALAQSLLVSQSYGQYGASPSQTGLFFDDFRQRQQQNRSGSSGTRDGDVTYDYSSGVYRDNEGAVMGQRSPDLETARELSRPSIRSGSNAFAARSVGDYTNYAGQYTSPTGFFAPTYTSDPFMDGRRNVKLGPVNVGFGFFQGLEYNDNINRSSTNPESDVISTTMLSIDANYRITQNNQLSITTGIGFDRYLENPDLAPYGSNGFVLNVLPGSTIAFDVKAGPVYFTLYNRFSVRPATRSDFAIAQNQLFGVFQNDSGLAANWRINSDWTLAMNYMHSFTEALSDGRKGSGSRGEFDEFNRVTDSLHGSLTYSPNGTWTAGFEGGSTMVDYETEFNSDGVLNNLGAFVVLPIGKTTYLRAAAGVQLFDFDDQPPSQPAVGGIAGGIPTANEIRTNTGDNSDLSDFYYSLTLSNRLNSRMTHALSLGHESALNLTSNFITADYANYGIAFVAWKGSRISLSGYIEDAEASGGDFAQDFFQYGGDFHISHRLTSNLQLGAGYHYGYTDASPQGGAIAATDSEFVQHSFNFDLAYALSRKATLSVGYRYYTTRVKIGGEDFDQNRIVMGFNYNF